MARGGPRLGQEGKAYSNRTDLMRNPIKTAPQRPTREQAAPETGFVPQAVPLDAPTQRPDEPVTAGAPVGPGPGPEILGLPDGTEMDWFRKAFQQAASDPDFDPGLLEHLRLLIEENE